MSQYFLTILLLFSLVLTALCISPVDEDRRQQDHGREEAHKNRHDDMMSRMKRIQESLKMKDNAEYRRYWEELVANNPGNTKFNELQLNFNSY